MVGYIRPGILNKRLATFNYCARYLGWKPQMYHAPMDRGKYKRGQTVILNDAPKVRLSAAFFIKFRQDCLKMKFLY